MSVRPPATSYQYAYVQDLTFYRPLYVRILAVLLVVSVSAEAAAAVFMCPFDQLIINAGALVLGVWGIRAILFRTSEPGVTSVDLALSVAILFLLVVITVRAVHFLVQLNQLELRLCGPAKPEAGEQSEEPVSPASERRTGHRKRTSTAKSVPRVYVAAV